MTTPDENSDSQLWDIIPQGTEGWYNLLNVHTQHIANLRAGSSNDYTPILSYTNDERNGESQNRLWYIIPNGPLPDEITGVRDIEPDEYALAYDPMQQVLHFGSETPERLTFTVSVHAANGVLIGQFKANEEFNMTNQPSGIYIVSWRCGNKTRSVKFKK